ncbi:hypothetical protein [Aliagarivorans taiwanensis]|uniref:hypothetical protein n=1 Tax=Aliagarivorans taiwanensis TaxID=561966 RepID=UPI00047BD88E|nr:hypothetical protein [Aliagarivorans taiwanensis]
MKFPPSDLCKALHVNLCHLNELRSGGDGFWGSNLDIALGSVVVDLTNKAVGFDITVDRDWTAYCNKATAIEIAEYGAMRVLQLLKPSLGAAHQEPVYLVVPENPDYHDDLLFTLQNSEPQIWFHSQSFVENAGWSAQELSIIAALEVNQRVVAFGDFCHTIYRIL